MYNLIEIYKINQNKNIYKKMSFVFFVLILQIYISMYIII